LGHINPRARLVLTVSPVPLVATAGDQHVMVASSYSKSVLRVAAERLTQQWSGVAYFPSFEIITGTFNRGQYFGADLRSVTDAGVDHVMRLFLQHYLNVKPSEPVAAAEPPMRDGLIEKMTAITRADCDEEALAR
jgi:hypothetical protein